MNLLVTMTAATRPAYTVRAIRAVRYAGYRGPILISVDHLGEESDRVLDAIEAEAQKSRLEIATRVNKPALGLWGPQNNAWSVYDWAFEERGAEAILAIEDDCILSPDAGELCEWFIRRVSWPYPSHSFKGVGGTCEICGYARRVTGPHQAGDEDYLFLSLANNTPSEGGRPLDLWESIHVNSPWAWCFTLDAWRKIRRRWNSKTTAPIGWDWSLQYNMNLNHWRSLVPALARAKNVGLQGSSTNADRWYLDHLKDAEVSDGTHGSNYRIVPPVCPDSELNWNEPWMDAEADREFGRVSV